MDAVPCGPQMGIRSTTFWASRQVDEEREWKMGPGILIRHLQLLYAAQGEGLFDLDLVSLHLQIGKRF